MCLTEAESPEIHSLCSGVARTNRQLGRCVDRSNVNCTIAPVRHLARRFAALVNVKGSKTVLSRACLSLLTFHTFLITWKMSCLENLPDVAADAAFALIEQYKADSSPHKVDLSPGFYRDEQAKPWTLPSVQQVLFDSSSKRICANNDQAERALYEDPSRDHEHLPLLGHAQLLSKARDLIFGVPPDQSASIASIQTIAGTGANHLGALLLAQACRPQTVWISDPSWINHTEIWKIVDDGIQRRSYPYFDPERFTIDFDGMLSTLGTEAQEGDVVILHGCAHNPTGLDLDKAQWREIAALCEKKRLIPFFDVA